MLDGIKDWVLDAFKEFFCWLIDFIFGGVMPAWAMLIGIFPDGMLPVVQMSGSVLATVDAWFPLSEGVTMFVGWWMFLVSFVAVKWLLKLVPFVG